MTAIDLLVKRLAENGILHSSDIAEANELFKQQIIDAVVWFDDTERTPSQIEIGAQIYYNETFKNTKE